MSLKQRLQNPFVQQYAIEILFPILGFYFFEWSLFMIGLFYLVDQLSAELVYFRRLWWVNKHSSNSRSKLFILEPILVFLLLFAVQLIALATLWRWKLSAGDWSADTGLLEEFVRFGADELWFLLPVVILVYHLKDTFTFYMPRRYLTMHLRKMINSHHLLNVLILLGTTAFVSVFSLAEWNDHLVLWVFILLKLLFDFASAKWMKKKV